MNIREKALVIYKTKPALITEIADKLTIQLATGEQIKLRPKDITLLHPGPLGSLKELESPLAEGDLAGAWELLAGSRTTVEEAAELIFGAFTPRTAWELYKHVQDGLYFTEAAADASGAKYVPELAVQVRSADEVEQIQRKRNEKNREQEEREQFLEHLRSGTYDKASEGRFLQDVEALALGKTDKSRTLRDLGRPETPQEAHKLLLKIGYWDPFINPYPSRFGCPSGSGRITIEPPPAEERIDLTGLPAFAIDNPWSTDPDDAVYIDGSTLYVHVADPAASVLSDCEADLEARSRGSTLYLPEGALRMLHEESLTHFALGLGETSPALTFKITLAEDGRPEGIDIFRSLVRVTRLTYDEADRRIEEEPLKALFAFAEKNVSRRQAAGAVTIEFPEVHLHVADRTIEFTPIPAYRSAEMVRECMLIAGEATALWAMRNRIPFPFIAQELGDLPNEVLPGLAGSYQLRRCMRPRRLSAQPGDHAGLGLPVYTQVTSPLRRYTDLLAHQQIRRYLRGENLLSIDEILERVAAGEAAALTNIQAERASKLHWTAVYLQERIGTTWDGVVVDLKGNRATLIIPELAMETQVVVKGSVTYNEMVRLELKAVKLPELECMFILP
ncbi:RNB domain-containing ribonuclease [Gracilinema caldarium]|uniref:Ribonuclease II n=1 Tax=Gracilinema caldarium (strain ATCC 51460 / DSM 7334 / H1) TaxID=744872 RepID=F8F2I1_GRAC1|nr:RNB domain-containing ribonuclease [Gracilinema caldarium]AEJ19096.1 ribonuclease II [Gracilinema caldarium DSM 7334]